MRSRVVITDQLQESNRAMQGMFERSHDSLHLALQMQSERIARFEKLLESLQPPGEPSQSVEGLAQKVMGKPAAMMELCDGIYAPDQEPCQRVTPGRPPYQLRGSISSLFHERKFTSVAESICICTRLQRSTTHESMRLGTIQLSKELEL